MSVTTQGSPPPSAGTTAGFPFVTERRLTRQLAVTIVAPVRPRQLAPLRRLLETMGEDPAGNAFLPFGKLSTVHFGRFVLLERARDVDGNAIPAQLIYMCDVDEPISGHLDGLLDLAPGIDRVFGACEGYPPRSRTTREARRRWLNEHMIDSQAYYVNTIGRTVAQTLQEAELRDSIVAFLDTRDWTGQDPVAVRAAIQEHVKTRPELGWAKGPAPGRPLIERLRDVAAIALPVAGGAVTAPIWLPLVPLYVVALLLHELTDTVDNQRPTAAHERLLAELEDRGPQNQFSAIGLRKPGLFRRLTIGIGIRGLDTAARHVFNNGTLTGVTTIHFAHWTMLDSDRRLIFASNYDGTVKSYNDDFIDKVWWGLNLVFSNGVGWPRTWLLVFGGAQNEQAFKNYLRRHQIPTQVWYSAYPELTVQNITNNGKIRAGLFGAMNPKEAAQWLSLL